MMNKGPFNDDRAARGALSRGAAWAAALALSCVLAAAAPPAAAQDGVSPDAATDLSAETGVSGGELVLRWTATGDDGAAGNITGGAFRVHYVSAPELLDLWQAQVERSTDMAAGSSQTWRLAGLVPGSTYYAGVWLADEMGNWSGASNAPSAWAQLAGSTAPAAPGSFSGTAASSTSINWAWPDDAVDEDGYRLRNSTGGLAAALGPGAAGHLETGLAVNTSYYRYAEVYNSSGSRRSPGAAVYTLSLPSSGTYVVSRTSLSVQLAWYANGNPSDTRWGIERSTDDFATIGVVKAFADAHTALTALDSGLTPYLTYYYRVLSYNGDGLPSDYGAPVSTYSISPPAAPTNFSGAAVTPFSIGWTWTDNSGDENGFRLRNSTGGLVIALGPNTVSYTKGGLGVNTAYQYTVEAHNSAGTGVSASTTVYTLSMTPAGSWVMSRSSRSVQVGWYANFNPAGTRYGVERSTNAFATYQTVKGWGDNHTALNVTDAGLTPLVTYYYRVFSYNGYAFRSDFDNPVSTLTLSPPIAPSSFTAVTQSTFSVLWSWLDNSLDEDGFRVRKPNGHIPAELPRNTTFWLQTGLTANTSNAFYIEAYNTAGAGASPETAGYTLSWEPAGTYVVSRTSYSVKLAWEANGNPSGTYWGVQRSSDGFASSQTIVGFANGLSVLDYTDTGLTAYATYYYRVRSFNLAGVPSAYDSQVSTFTISPPAAPGSFSGFSVSTGSIKWTWADNSPDENGFYLKAVYYGTVIADLPPNTTWYLETGLAVNSSYGRYVEAHNTAGNSVSGPMAVFTRSMKPSGTYVVSRGRDYVRLAWSANGNPVPPAGDTYWGVERSTDNFATSEQALTFADHYSALGYQDNGLSPHVTYYYRVLSYNGAGYASAWDTPVSTFTISTPTVPTVFAGTATGTGSILWTWADNSDDENGFRVRDTTGNVIAVLARDVTGYLKTGLAVNTSYFYRVEAFNEAGWSLSASSRVFTLSAPPSGAYVVGKTSYSVRFAWGGNGNSSGTRWGIERSTDNFAMTQALKVATHNYTAEEYLDEGLVADTTYHYRVRSFNGMALPSAWDAPVSTFTLSLPVMAGGFSGSPQDASSILWTWSDAAFNENGYRLKNSTGGVVASLPIGAQEYTETGLQANKAYLRYVEGYNTAGLTPSAPAAVFTLSVPPSGSYLMAVTSFSALLGWQANGNPAGTRWGIERTTDDFSTSQSLKVYDDDHIGTTFLDQGLDCGTTYLYRIRSYNDVGAASDFDGNVFVLTDPAVLPDTVPPSAVADLTAQPGPEVGDLLLTWTSPGDNWGAGADSTATLKIRYTDAPGDYQMDWAQVTISTSLSPGAGRQYLLSGLTLGVTWYAVVWLKDHSDHWSDLSNVSTGLARTPLVPAAPGGFSGAVLSSGSVLWTWTDDASTEDGYRVRTSTGGLLAALGAGATSWTETGLEVDASYTRYAEAYNFTGTGLSSTGSARTFAAVPAGFGFVEVHYSSMSLSWSPNGNRADALYRLEYRQAHYSTSSVILSTPAAFFAGLEESSTFYYRVGALNADGVLSWLDLTIATVTRTLPHISTAVAAQSGITLDLPQVPGVSRIIIPPGAFGVPVLLTLKTPLAMPPPGPGDPGAAAAVGLEVFTDPAVQPSRPVTVIIAYRDSDVAGMDRSRLAVGRYDPAADRWAVLPSFPDPAARTVTAYTGHFSLFRLFEVLPSQSVSSPWIYPNPFRPSRGHTLVTFSSLPAYSVLDIYTIDGNKIRALQCNASGAAYWDGKNSAGREVASGLYLVHTGLGREFGIMKVVVQR